MWLFGIVRDFFVFVKDDSPNPLDFFPHRGVAESHPLSKFAERLTIGIQENQGLVYTVQFVVNYPFHGSNPPFVLREDGRIESVFFFDVLEFAERLFSIPGRLRCLLAHCSERK